MKKIYLIFLILSLFLINSCYNNKIKEVCFEKTCFKVELAMTNQEKANGLMFRQNLEINKGMLFIFEKQDIYQFWMKNTLIPLDIIWINENKEIVYIKQNALPCKENCNKITPDKKAKYVLEINSGLIKELNIKTNDNVNLR